MLNFTSYYRCQCGAITLVTDDNKQFSCNEQNFVYAFPGVDLSELEQLPDSFSCDHCVNHYGLDLCACGSGAPVDNCPNDFDVCGKPMQSLEEGYTCVRAGDAIGSTRPGEIHDDILYGATRWKYKPGDRVRVDVNALVFDDADSDDDVVRKYVQSAVEIGVDEKEIFVVTRVDNDSLRPYSLSGRLKGGRFFENELIPVEDDLPEFKVGDRVKVNVEAVRASGQLLETSRLAKFIESGNRDEVFTVSDVMALNPPRYILSGELSRGGPGEGLYAQELIPVEDADSLLAQLAEAIAAEEKAKRSMRTLMTKVVSAIRENIMDGVRPLGSNCYSVNLSTVMSTKGMNE